MAIVKTRSVISGIPVKEAMRKQVIRLSLDTIITKCIGTLIKHKINTVLLTDRNGQAVGLVSKTDLIGAFYAGLSAETPLESIFVSPLLYCFPHDQLETALDTMQQNGVHQLYVLESESKQAVGILSYSDIVGLLYRYCRECSKSAVKGRLDQGAIETRQRLIVEDVMTPAVTYYLEEDRIEQVIDGLFAQHLGAVLIRNALGKPTGVISKTDLIIAYNHGIAPDIAASEIMNSPVQSCDRSDLLSHALQLMLLKDVQRLFVHGKDADDIIGILALSDAARFRAGSCRACIPGRIITGL
ncbi:MAG: CBS domain-containing protein [Desulfobacterales bacterium]|nr:CBS domain-containing protein [Desulfobacterales bacterium]